ncbi:hypothetical protein Tco_1184271 [Tanacetum coccineum]
MDQQVIPAAQLVPRYHTIRRCNNYVMLQSIPCSLECKIIRQILLDNPLSYALTATADVSVVYLQQFWRTVSKVPDTDDTIKFMLDTKELPTQWICSESLFICQWKLLKIHLSHQVDENYHSIKDDTPLVSVYTTRNVLVRGMLIPDAFLTEEIRATDDFKEYETVFVGVDGKKRKQTDGESNSPRKSQKITIRKKKQSSTLIPPPGDDRERDEVAEATILSLGSTSGIRACALRIFDLEVIKLENTQNNALAKLPMLKLGEYEMWEIRIKEYFLIQDYTLWEVIENGN